jgi:hypothetical protein
MSGPVIITPNKEGEYCLPDTVHGAMGITDDREYEIGQIVMLIEREGGTVAAGLMKLAARDDLSEQERCYATYRMAERVIFHQAKKKVKAFLPFLEK